MPEKMTAPIKLTKQQRNVLIEQIANKSGVIKMALERLTDHYLSQAAQNQDAFLSIREAVKWMRNHQSNLSRAANLRTKETENQLKDVESKLEYFLSAEHSEIMKFGKWVFGALNKSGSDRTMIKEYWTEYSCGRIEVEGLLPADDLREYGKGKLCPCCSERMVREPFSRCYVKGWEKSGDKWVNPEQVTIDHRYPKSTFPERMFDPDNFELVCYKCNKEKSDFFGSAIVKDVQEILDFAKSINF